MDDVIPGVTVDRPLRRAASVSLRSADVAQEIEHHRGGLRGVSARKTVSMSICRVIRTYVLVCIFNWLDCVACLVFTSRNNGLVSRFSEICTQVHRFVMNTPLISTIC